ncbi:Hypothetical predicted protein, partial [Mytilus galloprovincialis]
LNEVVVSNYNQRKFNPCLEKTVYNISKTRYYVFVLLFCYNSIENKQRHIHFETSRNFIEEIPTATCHRTRLIVEKKNKITKILNSEMTMIVTSPYTAYHRTDYLSDDMKVHMVSIQKNLQLLKVFSMILNFTSIF